MLGSVSSSSGTAASLYHVCSLFGGFLLSRRNSFNQPFFCASYRNVCHLAFADPILRFLLLSHSNSAVFLLSTEEIDAEADDGEMAELADLPMTRTRDGGAPMTGADADVDETDEPMIRRNFGAGSAFVVGFNCRSGAGSAFVVSFMTFLKASEAAASACKACAGLAEAADGPAEAAAADGPAEAADGPAEAVDGPAEASKSPQSHESPQSASSICIASFAFLTSANNFSISIGDAQARSEPKHDARRPLHEAAQALCETSTTVQAAQALCETFAARSCPSAQVDGNCKSEKTKKLES
jgi:hypothetical protein